MEWAVLEPGERIASWIVVRPLGKGGMGSVYLCRSAMSDRIQAAVKVLEPGRLDDERERFVREVEALDALRHPAIVRVKGFGDDPTRGVLWIAVRFVGGTLQFEVRSSLGIDRWDRMRVRPAPPPTVGRPTQVHLEGAGSGGLAILTR